MIGSLFSGIGGLEYGLEMAGLGPVAWQVEQSEYCRGILAKHWPDAVRFDDVCTVGAHNLTPVDVLCGGFPCQDLSYAGKGAGIDGARSGLWREYARIIGEIRPRFVVIENVAALLNRGMERVLGDLAAHGYDATWIDLRASDVGAPHRRERLFVVGWLADSGREQPERGRIAGDVAGPTRARQADGEQWERDGNAAGDCGQVPAGSVDDPDTRGLRRARPSGGAGYAALADQSDVEHAQFPRLERFIVERVADSRGGCAERAMESAAAGCTGHVPDTRSAGREQAQHADALRGRVAHGSIAELHCARGGAGAGLPESRMGRVPDGLPARLDRWPARPGEAQHEWEAPRVARGVPNRAARLKALGNAVVPQVAYVVGCMVREMMGGES